MFGYLVSNDSIELSEEKKIDEQWKLFSFKIRKLNFNIILWFIEISARGQ